MEMKETKKKTGIALAIFLFLFSIFYISHSVNALAVTNPLPTVLELARGESGRFWVQIQNLAGDPEDIQCTYSVSLSLPAEFDNKETIVIAASSTYDAYGTVTIPADADLGQYDGIVEVGCQKISVMQSNITGSKISQGFQVPMTVSVVEKRTKENMILPEKPSPFNPMLVLGGVGGIVTVVGGGYFYYKHKKKSEKII